MAKSLATLRCPDCGSVRLYRAGLRYLSNGKRVQRWLCRNCGYRFSESKVKFNVAGQIFESSEAAEDHTDGIVTGLGFSSKKIRDGCSFSGGKQVGSHNVSTVGKSSNSLRIYSSEHQVCANKGAKNLTSQVETKKLAGAETPDVKGKLVQFAFYCKKEGMTDATIKTFSSAMKRLAKIADINDSESVKEAIARMKVQENTKVSYCVAYTVFLRFLGKTWKAPRYKYRQKLPEFLPTEEEIDQLIAGCGPKTSTLLQLIKETGMRIGECLSLKWTCISFEKRVVTLTHAEKHSLPRVFRVSSSLISMIGNLPKQNEKVFGLTCRTIAENCLRHSRQKVVRRIGNPRIAKIHFHWIRHWFGTNEYHKRPDMDHVRRLLGHKSILNTQLYVNMEKAFFAESNEDYTVKIAENLDEACKLLEVGFEYVTDMNGKKLFRKRK